MSEQQTGVEEQVQIQETQEYSPDMSAEEILAIRDKEESSQEEKPSSEETQATDAGEAVKTQQSEAGAESEKVVEEPIEILERQLQMTCVSMGNPHAVFFCDDVGLIELEELGPAIENNELFPNRVNVHFVQIDNSAEFTMRTWERGSGITMACGSGACACCVAAVLVGQTKRACTAHLPGGDLDLSWSEKDNCVYMAGPAVEVFEGVWLKN